MKISLFKLLIFIVLFITATILGSGCDAQTRTSEKFKSELQDLKKEYVPDLTLDVLQAGIQKNENNWILTGETTIPEAKERVISLADSLLGSGNYQNDFIQLPHPSLGDSTYGIVSVSVANIRDETRPSAQLVDQNIMGQTLLLLKYDRGWYFIQTEYGYLGWMTRGSFVKTDSAGVEAWKSSRLVRVKDLFPLIHSRADESSEPVTDVVLNGTLKLEKAGALWSKVTTPDGRTGYIRSSSIAVVSPDQENLTTGEDLAQGIIASARWMMGIPYLWGGNSAKASDCSGYTQTVYRANGVNLPRDSRQQALLGDLVEPDSTFSNVRPGDLLFFGSKKRVTHVGISLGGTEFIHQGGLVAVNSLNPAAPDYSPYRHKSLKFIKRIL